MSDKPTTEAPAAEQPQPRRKPPEPKAKRRPLIQYLAPPNDRRSPGQTAMRGCRPINWSAGPVRVVDSGGSPMFKGQEKILTLDAADSVPRGPNVYHMSPYQVAEMIRQGGARAAIPKDGRLPAGAVKKLEEDTKTARLDRAVKIRESGVLPQAEPRKQTKAEERRYGRDLYTVLPLKSLEVPR